MLPPTYPFRPSCGKYCVKPETNNGVYIHLGARDNDTKISDVFLPITISNPIETGQLSRLNQRCRSRKQRDARVLPTRIHRTRQCAEGR